MHVPAPWCPIVIGLSRRDSSAALRPAAPDDSSAVQTAVAAFAQLDQVCAAAIAGINAANVGSFGNDGSCDYDCGLKEQTWWWKADFTTYVKTNSLIPSVSQIDCSAGFGNAFAPTGQWRDGQLPAASADFASAIETIRQIDAAVAGQGGVPTAAQTLALNQAFAAAAQARTNCVQSVNGAVQTLASFISYEQGFVSYLPGQANGCAAQITTWINQQSQNLIGQLACGGDDCQGQFNAMQATVTAAFVGLQTPLATAGAQLGTALQATALITGALINIQADLGGILDQLTQARNEPPASPLRTMHLNIVVNDWNDMVAYVQQQLAA